MYVLVATSVRPKVPKPPRTCAPPQSLSPVPIHPLLSVAKSSTTVVPVNSRGHPEELGLTLGLTSDREGLGDGDTLPDGDVLAVRLGVGEAVREGVGLGDAQDPVLVDTVTASMPSAACSWLPLSAQVIVIVAVGMEWTMLMSTARATSSPAFTAAPLGFWGAPQPLPREVTPAPLPLSKVATTTPSMATV